MGMFDYVSVNDPRFTCSEGHDLSGEEFQTKDFDCTLGTVDVINGRIGFSMGAEGMPHEGVFTGSFETYADCTKCPAFIQLPSGNLIGNWCHFAVLVKDGEVINVLRTSEDTATWLAKEPKQPWMENHEGPMPYEAAAERRRGLLAEWFARRS